MTRGFLPRLCLPMSFSGNLSGFRSILAKGRGAALVERPYAGSSICLEKRTVSWRSHYAGNITWHSGPLHVHHKQSTSLCRHSWLTPLTSSWKSMERSDGCQEKIVPRSETCPKKGQAPSAA